MRIGIIQNVTINDHRMIHTDGIARELHRRGHEVEVIIQDSKDKPQFTKVPYRVTYIPGKTYSILGQLRFMYILFRYLKRQNYDIIHTKNPFSSVIPALLTASSKWVIYDVRGLWIDFGVHSGKISKGIAKMLWKIEIICMKKVDRIIVISNELEEILLKKGIKEEKIHVIIGDGVNIEHINELQYKDIRDHIGIEGKIVGYVGSIERSRKSVRIIEAFNIVRKKIDTIKLVMIGPSSDEDINFLRKTIHNMKLDKCVFFTGFIPHDKVLQFIKSFDVAVSYHEENLPIFNVAVPTKILEYLATGQCIVTTNQKMYKNLLTHKINGYLTAQNIQSFAEGIIEVLENDKLSKQISNNALISAQRYSIRNIADKIEGVYKIICT